MTTPARQRPNETLPDRPRSQEVSAAADDGSRAALQMTLRKAARGDQSAWRLLIEAYSGRVFGLIRAQCNSSDLAEEITQSTFCTLVAKIGDYTELGRFEQWLFRIAINRLRDEMRRRKRQARPVEDEALHAFADQAEAARSGATHDSERVDPEQLRALRLAMTELSDTDQQIIHLRHNAGLSFKEIAEALDQPLGTVLARQHRALKKLAESLRQIMGREPSIGHVRRAPAGVSDGGDDDSTPENALGEAEAAKSTSDRRL